jgi:hypothetical protein
VPDDEDSLGLEGILSSDEVFGEVFSVLGNFSPHVVNHEGFGEVIFVVGERHSLEVESHGGSALKITELVHTGGSVHVSVEEFSHVSSVLGEVGVIETLIPGLVKVDNVVAFGREVSSELLVSEDLIEDSDLINGGFSTLISNSGSESERGGSKVDFPDKGLRAQHEGECGVSHEASRPSIVRSSEVLADLVAVVSSSHSPFEVVVSEDVVGVSKLGGVIVGLSRLGSISLDVVSSVNVNTVGSLRRLLSQVVETGSGVTSEVPLRHAHEDLGSLLYYIKEKTSLGYYKKVGTAIYIFIGECILTRVLANILN